MKNLFLSLIVAGTCLAAPSDDAVTARRAALDLAGAFTNDGFKLRDGHLTGTIKVGEPKIVRVNLFSGNEYWFTVAGGPKVKKLAISIFDEAGKAVASEPLDDEARGAVGFAPTASGPYLLKIEQVEGEPGEFALIYSYK